MRQKKLKLSAIFLLGLSLIGLQAQTDQTFTDPRDGNVYRTVNIGDQVWMAENLKYLPEVASPSTMVFGSRQGSTIRPLYYVQGYDGSSVTDAKATTNYSTYGVLYNWPAAMAGSVSSNANPSGVEGVCPTGWHLPSNAEWTELKNYLIANGYNWDGSTSGDKTGKSLAATSGWQLSSNEGAVGNDQQSNNSTGFTALPGGYRGNGGSFRGIGSFGYWWSAKKHSVASAISYSMHYSDLNWNSHGQEYGFSVRCVRD